MTVFILTIFAALAALLGGYLAINNRKNVHFTMALTSGLVLGLVAFDLLPEVFSVPIDPVWPMILFVCGFLLFHIIEKFILVHEGTESEYGPHRHQKIGVARGIALVGHSFLDGLSIGVSFQIDPSVGFAVALAVIGHRFADGFDTANFMLLHKNTLKQIRGFMIIVIIAPIVGGLTSLFITLSEEALALYLGFFAGVLMYIAASSILPQAHAKQSSYKAIGLTILGVVLMLLITRLV